MRITESGTTMEYGPKSDDELAAAIKALAGAVTSIADAVRYHADSYRETQASILEAFEALKRPTADQESDA